MPDYDPDRLSDEECDTLNRLRAIDRIRRTYRDYWPLPTKYERSQ